VILVIEGQIGVLMGEETFRATAGAYVLKPRGVPHTFWNPGLESARMLEIISPAVIKAYFEELAGILSSTTPGTSTRRRGSSSWGMKTTTASVRITLDKTGS
jgi:glyoxylate utilization-related uncharacterized protein